MVRGFWRPPVEESGRLRALTRAADRVELKLVVSEPRAASTLGIDLTRAQRRRVYFLDTPDLALERHGVVVRLRSLDRKPDDAVVKLRPVVPRKVPSRLRRSKRFVVDVDAMPGSYVCSGTLKEHLGKRDVEQAIAAGRPLQTLLSGRQLRLLAEHGPAHVRIEDLVTFGPVDVRRGTFAAKRLDRALTVERWVFPDGSTLLELSTRCRAKDAAAVAARTSAFLRARGVVPTEPQHTKTRATLAYFTIGRTAVRRRSRA